MTTMGWRWSGVVAGVGLCGLLGAGVAPAEAQTTAGSDPRVGLKPGLHDAGEAAWHVEKVATLPKPKGFFDPKLPAGEATKPEPPNAKDEDEDEEEDEKTAAERRKKEEAEARKRPPRRSGLDFANSDLAFSGDHLFVGNFNGYNIYKLATSGKLQLISSIVCPGGQGDVSVHGHLLVMSVEQTRGRIDCGTQGVTDTVSADRFRGVRIFDISDLRKPKQLAAVQTCRGSHTHTLVTLPSDPDNFYVYGSGTGSVRDEKELAECSGKDPKEDPNTALFSIDVIKVPVKAPEQAAIVSRPRIFADPESGNIAGLWPGGRHGEGTQRTSVTNQCHDITVFPDAALAAGACSGNGILLDISNPEQPKRLDAVVDKNFAYWHSATFTNDGTRILFTDEWGGGVRPRCRPSDPPTWGADAIFDIVDRKLKFAGYYKLPVPQTETENCVAHNGSLIPVPGRDIMAQAWYQGGMSIFDFTDAARPVEIAYFDRGPVDAKQLHTAGYWSTYWYNGYIYGAEMARGIDVFRLKPSEFLSANEIEAARQVVMRDFNTQRQPKVVWPASSAVARAYMDQLARSNALPPARATAIAAALADADKLRGNADGGAPAVRTALTSLAGELDRDAAAASGRDAQRLKALAETLRHRLGQS